MQKQKTLAKSFSMQGKGLHTGLDIQITFNPAPENHGYKIKRVDLEGQPVIDALAENVASTQRGTVLSIKERHPDQHCRTRNGSIICLRNRQLPD